jgi:hypothetical protein
MVEVVEVFSAHKFILKIYQIYLTVNFVIRVGPEGSGRKNFKIATRCESMAINENGGE